MHCISITWTQPCHIGKQDQTFELWLPVAEKNTQWYWLTGIWKQIQIVSRTNGGRHLKRANLNENENEKWQFKINHLDMYSSISNGFSYKHIFIISVIFFLSKFTFHTRQTTQRFVQTHNGSAFSWLNYIGLSYSLFFFIMIFFKHNNYPYPYHHLNYNVCFHSFTYQYTYIIIKIKKILNTK